MVLLSFLTHVICALNFCIPHQESSKSEPLYQASVGFRSLLSEDEELDISTPPIVHTPFGGLEGYISQTIKGRPLAAFLGIPYAKPPVGNLRFREPEKVEPWTGVRIANKTGPICLQLDAGQYYRVDGHEDCLHINVYTPKLPKGSYKPKLPVIAYIHGGAFFFGSGNYYGPSYLLDQDVILITFNYRLGVLGFLSTGDETCPGNNGLKDQAMALKWVQDNIEYFGGDKEKITFMGQSAGAVSANLHLMSKQTRHIPTGAILHSGTANLFWSIVESTQKNSKVVAKSMGCKTSDSAEMVECLRSQNPYLLVYRQKATHKEYFFPFINFGPVVEPPSEGAFLEMTPEEAYRTPGEVANVPILGGLVKNEGDLFAFGVWLWPGILRDLNRIWNKISPYMFDYANSVVGDSMAKIDEISRDIKNFYFGDQRLSFWNRNDISNVLGDRLINVGVHKGLVSHAKIAPTYGFFYNFRGKSVATTMGLNREDWGITHLEDLLPFFNSTFYFQPVQLKDKEFAITEFMTNVWVNFATTGKPTFTNDDGDDVDFWGTIKPEDGDAIQLLEINKEPKMIQFPYLERVRFWNNLPLKSNSNKQASSKTTITILKTTPTTSTTNEKIPQDFLLPSQTQITNLGYEKTLIQSKSNQVETKIDENNSIHSS